MVHSYNPSNEDWRQEDQELNVLLSDTAIWGQPKLTETVSLKTKQNASSGGARL